MRGDLYTQIRHRWKYTKRSPGNAPVQLSLVEAPGPSTVDRVFRLWCTLWSKRTGVRLTPRRRSCIRAALADYPIADVERALRGYAKNPWHRGENPTRRVYDEIALHLRDPEHIDAGLAMADAHSRMPEADEELSARESRQLAAYRAEVHRLRLELVRVRGISPAREHEIDSRLTAITAAGWRAYEPGKSRRMGSRKADAEGVPTPLGAIRTGTGE